MKKIKIVLIGGGTGGHLMPVIAVARELRKLHPEPDLKLYYIGPADKPTKEFLKTEGLIVLRIAGGKIRRYFSFKNIVDILFNIPISFIQSFFLFLFIWPKLVFSKGGTGSLPVAYCAKLLKRPVFIHESDVSPGLSNRAVYRWAKKIFTSFAETESFARTEVTVVGNPIRSKLLEEYGEDSKKALGISSEKPVLLFLGGSQGAEYINEFILIILNDLLKKYEVIHVSGLKNYKKCEVESKIILDKDLQVFYHLRESLQELELKQSYLSADLVISRAGSGSIFEIAAFGKPSILIPLPSSASNHQFKNAYQYSRNGASVVIEQENLTPNFFMGEIEFVVSNQHKKDRMIKSALEFARPNAAEDIAKEILQYLTNV